MELVLPAGGLSAPTLKALRGALPCVLTNWLRPGSAFWDAERLLRELDTRGYFGSAGTRAGWPPLLQVHLSGRRCICLLLPDRKECAAHGAWHAHVHCAKHCKDGVAEEASAWWVQQLAESPDRNRETLCALGGAVGYMCSCLLDKSVLPLRRILPLPSCSVAPGLAGDALQPEAVSLDGSAFDNLEVGHYSFLVHKHFRQPC